MKTRLFKTLMFLIPVVAAGALVATDAAAQVNLMSGKSKVTIVKREMVAVGDVEGHVLVLTEASGINENVGKWAFMEGATTFSRSIVDITKGNGTYNGYFILSKGNDLAISNTTGTVKTVLSPEGKPLTTYAGEWKWVKCAGLFEGCAGQGVYQGTTLSEKEIMTEYKGTLFQ